MPKPRRPRKPPGAGPEQAKRDHYLRLMAQGMNNSAACRKVGINRRTGTRWRYGRTITSADGESRIYAPIAAPKRAVSTRYLSESERITIADEHRAGSSSRTIAALLDRAPSTISREINRNSDPETGDYHPFAAHQRAAARRPRPKPAKLRTSAELRELVQELLDQRWSPEQICRTLPSQYPDRPELRLTPETIYQALYRPDRGGLTRSRLPLLRTGRTYRKRRRSREQRTPRFTDRSQSIHDRPGTAEDRALPGHWEGDLIMGAHNRTAIGTLVERTTRYVLLVHLPQGRNAAHFRDRLITTFSALPAGLRQSLAWDQGVEMGRHAEFTAATSTPVYFCDPASPWQRGSNENTNGLLRQYFPKSSDLSMHTAEDLTAVATELNNRPRKILDWDTPAQRFTRLLAEAA
ncbi:IS30 family transposase [Actinoplanes xinjiangensis]|uniref:IS30 family transposase n=2 Tax=Actinoplanes xinjiangensis TaxID=512350 RepID=A0A316EKC1_9ACTN|nr:IS30 family transposase [Actinoplanes xinjiangensis]GIF44237.1 IS30 family transposase [Actinoplanes xinjiangensis]